MTWRSRPSAAIAAVTGLLVASALTAAAPASAAPARVSAPTAARVPAAAAVKPWRVYDPAAYARAVRSGNWVYTPEGLADKTCVHHVPPGGKVARDGNVISRSGAVQHVVPCTHPTLAYHRPGTSRAVRDASPGAAAATSCKAGNLQWWAETCALDPAGLAYLNERFSMPANPASSGALIFFFPSFEDSTGNSIVQPVLTWGANPGYTGVTNPDIWYITSWYGDDGTYYVSPSAHVQPGGTVVGEIQRGLCATGNTNCEWITTTTVGSASVSLVWFSGPEMTQVNGGVMEVPRASGCVETPPGGHEAFRNLTVHDSNGSFTPTFQSYTVNGQCSVHATATGTSTDITWAP